MCTDRLRHQRGDDGVPQQLRAQHQSRLLGTAAQLRPIALHPQRQNRQTRVLHPVQHGETGVHGLPAGAARQFRRPGNAAAEL